jgi:signal peptidase II
MLMALERFANMLKSAENRAINWSALPWRWWAIALLVLALDQLTKQLALKFLEHYGEHTVTSFFYLTLRYNEGAAFSLLHSAGGWQRWLFASIASAVSVVLIVWIARIHRSPGKLLEVLGLSLILGGALGNLYDRIMLGHVVDFIVWHYQGREWPAFNIADAGICLGAGLLLVDMIKGQKKNDE